jgi:hypothetical protein
VSQLGLTMRAPVAAPFLAGRPELLGPDERAAATTRLPRAPIDITPSTWTKITGGCLLRPPLVRLEQLVAALGNAPQIGQVAHRRTRMNSMEKEQLRSIESPEPCEVPLIEQCLPNRAVRLGINPLDCLVHIPVGPEEVGPKMSHNSVLSCSRNEFHDGQPISDSIMIIGREHGTDLERRFAAPAPSSTVDLPNPVHLEVRVQGELVAESEQLVLAARDHLAYADACQIGRCQGGYAELRPSEHATGKDLIQPPAGPPDGITLGHGLIVPAVPQFPDTNL